MAVNTGAPGAPTLTLTAPASSPSNSTTASFTFTGAVDETFQCSLDGAAYAACTSPVNQPVPFDCSGIVLDSSVFKNRGKRSTLQFGLKTTGTTQSKLKQVKVSLPRKLTIKDHALRLKQEK